LKELLGAEWREDDLFQVPVLLYTLLKTDPDRSFLRKALATHEYASKMQSLIAAVLSARPMRRDGETQKYSDYILFQCCQVYSELQDSTLTPKQNSDGDMNQGDSDIKVGLGGLPPKAVPEGASSQIPLALTRCAETSFNELCRQLAYRVAGETASFDAIRLAYSLLTYIKSTTSMSGTAGRELVLGNGPSPGTKTAQLNRRIVKAALAAFFDEQIANGLWDKGQPIYKNFRRQGRNVGNAFVFSVDTLGSLLETLPAEDFRPHLFQLQNVLSWIESHQLVEVVADYCDAETGQCFGKPLRGWSTPHLSPPDSGPQAWATAQVMTCVSLLRSTIQQLMNNDVLNEFNGIALSVKGVRPAAWDRLLNSDLGTADGGESRTIKSVLEERMVIPFATSVNTPGFGAAYSAILFGPPGTAKVCEKFTFTGLPFPNLTSYLHKSFLFPPLSRQQSASL
jgi:hypothetical protein